MRSSTLVRTGTSAALASVLAASLAAPALAQIPGEDTLRSSTPEGFVIGTAVAGGGHHLDQPYPDPFFNDEPYREVLAHEFNSVSPENQMKWEFIHPERDVWSFEAADAIVAFAEENDQDVRGHTLLWHSQNPAWLEEGDFTAEELRAILEDHITTVVSRYAGQIDQWDVANEIFDGEGNLRTTENIWIRELGPDVVADAFRWAHEADPDALLFFNDYGVESINAKSDAYYTLIQELLADGVPVHGFSAQGHLDMRWPAPSDMQANLQRFADLGLETAVTEVDVRMEVTAGEEPTAEQLEAQADYYQSMLEQCLAVEGCNSFTVWGFTDKYSWVPVFFPNQGEATIMDEEFNRKPAYDALQETLVAALPPEEPTEEPTTEVPTEEPTTEVPTTEVPTTEVPTTEVPTTAPGGDGGPTGGAGPGGELPRTGAGSTPLAVGAALLLAAGALGLLARRRTVGVEH